MCDHRPTILLKIQHASRRCSVWMENPSGIIGYRMVYPSYYFTFCLDGKPSKYQWMGNPSCSKDGYSILKGEIRDWMVLRPTPDWFWVGENSLYPF